MTRCASAGTRCGTRSTELHRLADDHRQRIEWWCEFASATGWRRSSWYYAQDPLPQTVACARVWSGGAERAGGADRVAGAERALIEHLVTLYAIESAQSAVLPRQLDALVSRYGLDGDRATRYFRLSARSAAGNAELLQAALTSFLPAPQPLKLRLRAERAHRAYWELLDGVEEYLADVRPAPDGGRRQDPRGPRLRS